jgi:hypothetical protein
MEKQRLIVPNRQVTSLEEAMKIVNEMAANYINKEISDEEIAIEFAEWIRIKDFQTTAKDNWIGLDMQYYTTKELYAKWYCEQLKQRQ